MRHAVWERKLKERIKTQRAIHIEELQEKFWISKEKHIEMFKERLLAINQEREKRDLSDVPTPTLLEMQKRCFKALEKEMVEQEFLSDKEIARRIDERILANSPRPVS